MATGKRHTLLEAVAGGKIAWAYLVRYDRLMRTWCVSIGRWRWRYADQMKDVRRWRKRRGKLQPMVDGKAGAGVGGGIAEYSPAGHHTGKLSKVRPTHRKTEDAPTPGIVPVIAGRGRADAGRQPFRVRRTNSSRRWAVVPGGNLAGSWKTGAGLANRRQSIILRNSNGRILAGVADTGN